MKRILITPRSLAGSEHPAVRLLREQGWEIVFGPRGRLPSEKELTQLVPNCEGWLAGIEQITTEVLDAAQQLQVISRNGSGIDNIPLEETQRRGIAVFNAAGANAQGVAELTLGLSLAAIRRFDLADRQLKEGKWTRLLGSELKGKQVLVVGFGQIGRLVAHLFSAFGSIVSVVEPFNVSSEPFAKVALPVGISSVDLVTLHCPPLPNGQPLVTAELLRTSRSGLILINCARRSLVDESAVVELLETRQLGIYVSDVFDEAGNSALVGHPHVIATPHLGAYTRESVDRAALEAAENLIRFFAHAPR